MSLLTIPSLDKLTPADADLLAATLEAFLRQDRHVPRDVDAFIEDAFSRGYDEDSLIAIREAFTAYAEADSAAIDMSPVAQLREHGTVGGRL